MLSVKTNKFTYEGECESCKGTGLYVGLAEANGSAVVCHNCKGSGKFSQTIRWKTFTGRKKRKDIRHVLQANPGIGVGESKERNLKLEDFGGQSYEDWADGESFPPGSEMRKFTCPAWWYQTVNYKLKPSWDECIGVGSFSQCDSFENKDKCWDRFDKEQGKK